ncbi:hypothetical protein TPHA_0F02320 [Tetrapisispora phaffii CBS 4417]|uniref:Mid2 domain-containing protein n=1 Tax=Tetrapisispora phaffii (strain ATCC 24235 / CBS 4417 / NBRC 1672 / NRRL Y-8282 / UCD 70-5) TaxID=1071381 RepID=G8BUC7_TETPH|nr:hypothetical protein TPHA_0F02320 [Tetrapisispora phaffii CBS 4417]CCE63713.1 hypothetical protein TPHA_0F02320 [Tetrapisispora phaffii CBS 4417]
MVLFSMTNKTSSVFPDSLTALSFDTVLYPTTSTQISYSSSSGSATEEITSHSFSSTTDIISESNTSLALDSNLYRTSSGDSSINAFQNSSATDLETHFTTSPIHNLTISSHVSSDTSTVAGLVSSSSIESFNQTTSKSFNHITTITPSIYVQSFRHATTSKLSSSTPSTLISTISSTSVYPSSSYSSEYSNYSTASPASISRYSLWSSDLESSTLFTSTASSSNSEYSISTNSSKLYLIYTQTYVVTGSSIAFTTDILMTTRINPTKFQQNGTPTYTYGSNTITTNLAYYNNLVTGKTTSTSSKNGKIAGGVIGALLGFIIICIVTLVNFRRKSNKSNQLFLNKNNKRTKMYHTNGRKVNYDEEMVNNNYEIPRDVPEDVSNPFTDKTRTIATSPSTHAFQKEFNFENRKAPEIPRPRKIFNDDIVINDHDINGNVQFPSSVPFADNNTNSNIVRISSTDSSIQSSDLSSSDITGSTITIDPFVSSAPHYPGNHSNSINDDGYLKEIF